MFTDDSQWQHDAIDLCITILFPDCKRLRLYQPPDYHHFDLPSCDYTVDNVLGRFVPLYEEAEPSTDLIVDLLDPSSYWCISFARTTGRFCPYGWPADGILPYLYVSASAQSQLIDPSHTLSFTLSSALMASNYAGHTKKTTATAIVYAGWAAGLIAGPRER